MLKVERKCSLERPKDDGVAGASEWNVSPLLAGDKVVVSSRTPNGTRSYLRAASDDGRLKYVTKRKDATVFSILSQTGERDPLRERNEIQLYAEADRNNGGGGGFVYLTSGESRQLKVFADAPQRSEGSRIRLVPSLLTEERVQRQFRKSEPASPFIFTPDTDLDRFTQDEGPLVRYGDVVIFRAPTLEFDDNYQYIACSAASDGDCSIVQANVETHDATQAFSFQCPSGGLMYARTVPAETTTAGSVVPSTTTPTSPTVAQPPAPAFSPAPSPTLAVTGDGSGDAQPTVILDTVDTPKDVIIDDQSKQTASSSPEETSTAAAPAAAAADKETDINDSDDETKTVVDDPSTAVIAAVQEKENPSVKTDRPKQDEAKANDAEENDKDQQPAWYEQPLGLAAIALLALTIVAFLVWSIIKVVGGSGSGSSPASAAVKTGDRPLYSSRATDRAVQP